MDLRSASTDDLLAWRDRIIADALTHFDRSEIPEALDALRTLELATVDIRTLELTDPLLDRIADGRRVVATFDPRRRPAADEVVIIYGNYPHAFTNVVVNNPIRRHVADFWRFRHERVEYDRRWEKVDHIFVINADRRNDRYDAVLRELAAAGAPFDRITRHSASVVDRADWGDIAGHIGCLQSHIEILRKSSVAGFEHTLVLEDDFCFTSDIQTHLTDLQTFLERRYSYWVCLVATSKYGAVVPHDDLIALSYQACTNTGGYLISREGIDQVLQVFNDSLAKLKATGQSTVYAADRCWRVLQPSGKFMVFRRKFGFQNSSFSDIEHAISRYLD